MSALAASAFDLVGDVHGMVATLRAMVEELGYSRASGRWRHPEGRVLVSLGDLVDRGPDPFGCVELIRDLVEDGAGLMVLGNHELNAVHFDLGLRKANATHKKQVATTRRQWHADRQRWVEIVRFLESVPTRLELDEGRLRVVHAFWDERLVGDLPLRIDCAALWRDTAPGGRFIRAVESCIKGPEEACEDYLDLDGHRRSRRRVSWWREHPATAPFTVFGHYAMAIEEEGPRLLGPGGNAACVDWRAGHGGPLVALRWPERRFVVVPNRDRGSESD